MIAVQGLYDNGKLLLTGSIKREIDEKFGRLNVINQRESHHAFIWHNGFPYSFILLRVIHPAAAHPFLLSISLMNRCAISSGRVMAPPTITAQTPISSICTASSGVCTLPSPMTGMGRSFASVPPVQNQGRPVSGCSPCSRSWWCLQGQRRFSRHPFPLHRLICRPSESGPGTFP